MNYLYILLPVAVWFISQTIKFLVRIEEQEVPTQLRTFFWTYMWAGGAPSTHTAVLTSSLVLVLYNFGLSPIFTFCLVVTMLWLYDMVTDRKRQEIMNDYFAKDKDLRRSVHDGILLDLAGHTAKEIAWGAVLGITLGFLAVYIIN